MGSGDGQQRRRWSAAAGSGGGQLPRPGLSREAKYRGSSCCTTLNKGLCPWHGVGGREESCQWGPGGWYPHPAASRPRRLRDTDSTRRTRGVTQRHTRAHAGAPGWGVSTRAPCPCSPRPLIVGTSRCVLLARVGTRVEGWSRLDAGLCSQDLGVSQGRGDQPGSHHAHAMHTRVRRCTRAQACPHTHSHVPHTLPHCSAPGLPAPVPGCAKVEDGEENLGESRGARGKRERLGQQVRATDSIPSNRQRRLLRWLQQPLGKAAGSGGSRGNTARGRAASAVPRTLIKPEPGQRRSN